MKKAWFKMCIRDRSSTMGSNDVMSEGEPLDDKTDGFTNEYKSKDLVFKKEVVGNQASRDKYFEFTLKLENVGNENTFTVSIADDNDPNTCLLYTSRCV